MMNQKKNENNISNDNKNNSIKEINNNIPIITISPSQKQNNLNLNQLNLINNNKHKDEDYYHVNVSNITYYIYNYSSGFIEALKDHKYKVSKVVNQINKCQIYCKSKIGKRKKKQNINKKISNDDELNNYGEKTIKLKEIQKALTSKEKQSSIINLCIFSFIIFSLVIGTALMSIMINFYLKNKSYMLYSLIRKSIELYKNLIYEINFVRELLIINSILIIIICMILIKIDILKIIQVNVMNII